jgi:hypothetical protein
MTQAATHLEIMQIENFIEGRPRSYTFLSGFLLVCNLHLNLLHGV